MSAKPRKGRVGVDGNMTEKHNNRVELDSKDKIGSNKVNGTEVGDNKITKKKNHQKIFKSKKQ